MLVYPITFNASAAAGEVSNPNTNLREEGGTDSSWDSGWESTETIPANTTCYCQFTVKLTDFSGNNGNYAMFGFSRSSDTPATGFSGIRYAAYLRYSGSGTGHAMRVFESGSQVYAETAVSDGDIISVHRDGGTGAITYKLNGTTVYTSGVTDTNELKMDGTFLNNDDRVEDVILNRGNGDFNPFYSNKVFITEY